ncbi:hypothetical protein DSO57_1024975 [Entomophthora muscae]|uniref:Uncharacterized protein n=1 Tax=Entomophthora muscae TaxID=34485 RepID=A0ACC2TPX9_9FUNG|nr:hypothetical protein DSO57_1024975 [Entomophthora muscae]
MVKKAGKGGVSTDYPQALVIQNGVSSSIGYDMEMFVKACDYCVYPGTYGEDKGSIDMVEIIIHEMGHGLGFISNLANSGLCGSGGPSIWYSFVENYSFAYIKESLFDAHLYTKEESLHEMFEKLHSTRRYRQPLEMQFVCSHETVHALKRLLATPDSIYFKTTKGSRVFVETNENVEVSRVSHTNWGKYYTTLDFLMVPFAFLHGHVLKEFTRPEDWRTAPFGKLTLEVFETLGYTVNLNPDPNRSQLAFYLQMKKHLFNHS